LTSCQALAGNDKIAVMEISFLGHSSFKLKGKTTTVVTDPFSSVMVGFKFPKTTADIVTVSHQHQDHNCSSAIEGEPFIICAPGEYEVKGVSVFGFPSFHDTKSGAERGENIIFLIEVDGIKVCHLGDLGVLSSAKIMEEIIGADVLLIPVGGVYTIGPKEAVEVVNQLEPKMVIPMHFKSSGKNEELSSVEDFLEQMGAEQTERLDKLSLTKDKVPEEMKVVVLERKT